MMISTLFLKSTLLDISFSIRLQPWIIVVWSFLFNIAAMFSREISSMLLQRYITSCLGRTYSAFLFLDVIISGVNPKWSATILIMREGVISFGLFGYITSFKASSAKGRVSSTLFNFAAAIILLNAPSSSRIFDLMLVAMYLMISSSTNE